MDLYSEIRALLPCADVREAEPMAAHTSFRVGGPADAMLVASSAEEIEKALGFCRANGAPWFAMGNGTNLVVRKGGIRGLVIKVAEKMGELRFSGNRASAGAGLKLTTFARDCIQKNFSGLERLGGIPGTVGGAVAMNAGAYGGCISDALRSVKYIDSDGNIAERAPAGDDMGYRTSVFLKERWIIIQAEFELKRDFDGEARKTFDRCQDERRKKQPLTLPSAGSVFKRPEGYYAGKLIEDAGLKGASVGGAMVSELHAGFIVNTGGATPDDVIGLIERVKNRVFEASGVMLEPEVRIIGED